MLFDVFAGFGVSLGGWRVGGVKEDGYKSMSCDERGGKEDVDALVLFGRLVVYIKLCRRRGRMNTQPDSHSVEWFVNAIRSLPSDDPVPVRTPGYNVYPTQKEHWLGWLQPSNGTGTYTRRSGNERGARHVYGQIGEPLMLLWLASAAGVPKETIQQAKTAASHTENLRSKCGKIRAHIPWAEVAAALSRQ